MTVPPFLNSLPNEYLINNDASIFTLCPDFHEAKSSEMITTMQIANSTLQGKHQA